MKYLLYLLIVFDTQSIVCNSSASEFRDYSEDKQSWLVFDKITGTDGFLNTITYRNISNKSDSTGYRWLSNFALGFAYFTLPGLFLLLFHKKKRRLRIRTFCLFFSGASLICMLTADIGYFHTILSADLVSAFLKLTHVGLLITLPLLGLAKLGTKVLKSKESKEAKVPINDKNSSSNSNELLGIATEKNLSVEHRLRQENIELEQELLVQTTELQQEFNKNEQVNRLFSAAQAMLGIGIWELNLENKNLYWSDKVYDIHGLPRGCDVKLQDGINFYRSDYRPKVEAAVNESITNGKKQNLEFILVKQDGTEIWVHSIFLPVVRNGKTVKLSGLLQDITDIKEYQMLLQGQNDELEVQVKNRTRALEAANEELKSFSYSVSHDLKSPLRSIDGFARALKEDNWSQLDNKGKDSLNRILKVCSRMGNLINALLDLSRLSRANVNRELVDLSRIASEIVSSLPPNSAEFKIQPHMSVKGDRALIKILLENLIDNAVKYSRKVKKPKITLTSDAEGGVIYFMMSDNGVGFDMQYADKLFGVFQRFHSNSEYEGTGIGLATVKKIINKHNGEIWAYSEPGKGATFRFSLSAIP